MSLRVLYNAPDSKAFIYDSVSEKPCPIPMFHDDGVGALFAAQSFLAFLDERDPRDMTEAELDEAHKAWRESVES